jgi:hypothetical protein
MSDGDPVAAAMGKPAAVDMRAMPGLWIWLAVIAVLAVLPHVPGLNSDFGRSLLSQMGIAVVFALSYNVLFGQTGLLSFGHAVYFGLGGYVTIHVMRAINHGLPLPMPLVPLAGAVGGLLFGLLFGALTTRRAGTIFALISLGVGELVYAATFMMPGYFGGEEGITASRTKGSRRWASISGRSSPSTISRAVDAARSGPHATGFCAHPGGADVLRGQDNPDARSSWVTTRTASASLRLPSRPCSRAWRAVCTLSTTRSSPRTRSARSARERYC